MGHPHCHLLRAGLRRGIGATDGTFLWALKHIPIVTMGAGDRQVPHQRDEWVDLDQLVETVKIYALTALHYLSQDSLK